MYWVELKKKFWGFLIFFLILSICLVTTFTFKDMTVKMMESRLPEFQSVMMSMPFSHHVSEMVRNIVFGSANYYYWNQWVAKNLFQFYILLALIMGAREFVILRENRTVYLPLNFVTREELYSRKIFSGLTVIGSITLLLLVINLFLGRAYVPDIAVWQWTAAYAQVMITAIILYLAASLVSLALTSRSKVYVIALVIIFLLIVFSLISPQIFGFSQAYDVMIMKQFHVGLYLIYVAIGAGFYFWGYQLCRKVDF